MAEYAFMGGGDLDTRNLVLAAILSFLIIFGWQAFFAPPPPPPDATTEVGDRFGGDGNVPPLDPVTGAPASGVVADAPATRGEALDSSSRVPVSSGAVQGTISLKGGRLDDLKLSLYRETLLPESETVTLLNPTGSLNPYYVVYGWLRTPEGNPGPLPGANTDWSLESGETLTPSTPVTLAWDNGQGLIFRRTMAIDERYMLTVTQSVENTTGAAVSLAPYGYVARRGQPDTIGFFILHEGAVGEFDGELSEVDYDDMEEMPLNQAEGGRVESFRVQENGFLGFTDKYWMTTLAGGPDQPFDAVYKTVQLGGTPEYRTEMRLPVTQVPAGGTASVETYLFAGAKEVATLNDYIDDYGVAGFDDAVDWGWFYFLTKPIFTLLMWVHSFIGNMGFAIIALTLLIKAVLFPLAYKSYVSMSKMKKLQPEMERLKEAAGDDKQKLQQGMLELYKKEKVNPASGCLPILLQIPIFFSLYKVLFVTIEMRHAPFIWWIDDLSAPDPTSWLNLFGLLPYDVSWAPIFISIGVLPILMGITMWMQQKLNPSPTDPTQAMIFAWMPWLFMFMLGSFASGLVVYWVANNVITFVQQYAIMRSQGVDVDFFGNVKKSFRRKPVTPARDKSAKTKAVEDEAAQVTPEDDTDADEAPEPQPAVQRQRQRKKKRRRGRNDGGGMPSGDSGPSSRGPRRTDYNSGADGGDGGGGGGGGGD